MGKVLDVDSGGKKNGTNIQQYEYNGTFSHQWLTIKEGKLIKFSWVNDFYLHLNGGNVTFGYNI